MNSNNGRSVLVAGAVVVALSLLVWAGVHNARERKLAMQQQTAKAVLVPQAAATADEEDGALKLKNTKAPAFSLVALDGKKVALADYKGKPVMLNFWATWCGPCKLEMPWLEEFQKKYASQGLVVLGVAADEAPKSAIAKTVEKLGVTYPILLKDDKVEDAYGGVGYLPESFYVGRDGKILIETAGLSSETGGKDEIEANIRKLLAAGN